MQIDELNPTLHNITWMAGYWGQALVGLLTALVVWFAYSEYRRKEKRDLYLDQCQVETREVEIYQRLEMKSLTVFRYEADYAHIIHWYKTLVPSGSQPFSTPILEANLCARKYYEMSCNLFEIAIRLRTKNCNYIEDDVFGSWVVWFFDVSCEWGFRAVWADLRDNYTPTLRQTVFDPYVREMIERLDIPHAEDPGAELHFKENVLNDMRQRFYSDMCREFGCDVSKIWPAERSVASIPKHPREYS